MAREALALHLEGLTQDGEVIPQPSAMEALMAERENRDAVAVLVDPPSTPIRSVRINITLPADVLVAIDRHAESQGLTRSGFLARAAKKELSA